MANEASRIELVTAPSSLPVSPEEARAACRISADDTSDDGYLTILIAAATEMLQGHGYLGQSFSSTAWRAYWDGVVSGAILLPVGPLDAANDVSRIAIDAGAGPVDQMLSEYMVCADKFTATISPPGGVWPIMKSGVGALIVEFTAASGGAAPAPVKLAILSLVAFWFDSRDAGMGTAPPERMWQTIEALLANERRF